MPEMRFLIRWPDGEEANCYSPSLVVKDYLSPGTAYSLADFLARIRTALHIASDRVEAKYGTPCSRALGQLRDIERCAGTFADTPTPIITCLAFFE